MADIEKLREEYQSAEQKAQKLMFDKDEAILKVRDRYGEKLRAANDDAAAAQKRLADAEAAQALAERRDAAVAATVDDAAAMRERQNYGLIAANLGLTLPE